MARIYLLDPSNLSLLPHLAETATAFCSVREALSSAPPDAVAVLFSDLTPETLYVQRGLPSTFGMVEPRAEDLHSWKTLFPDAHISAYHRYDDVLPTPIAFADVLPTETERLFETGVRVLLVTEGRSCVLPDGVRVVTVLRDEVSEPIVPPSEFRTAERLYAAVRSDAPEREKETVYVNTFLDHPTEPEMLRTYLEARFTLCAEMRACAETYGLLLQPLSAYETLLEREGTDYLRRLRAHSTIPRILMAEFLVALRNIENALCEAFCMEWEQVLALTAFLNEKKEET